MRVFDIYEHPKYGMQAVRRGFSWLAFLAPSVWAVRRGLGFTTLLLVVVTSTIFDLAQWAGSWINNPVSTIIILMALIVLVGIKPGFMGYHWHARALQQDHFTLVCTVAASSRRQAIHAAANDDCIDGSIRVAAA